MTIHEWLAQWSEWGWPLLANHLWQATLFSAIAFPAALLLRRGPSRTRYAIWVIAGLKFALPSVLLALVIAAAGFDIPAKPASIAEGTETLAAVSQVAAPLRQSSDADAGAQRPAGHREVYCELTLVWLSGAAFLLGSWLYRRIRFSRA